MIRSYSYPSTLAKPGALHPPIGRVRARTRTNERSRTSLLVWGFAGVLLAFTTSLASSLAGSVALESARRDNLGFAKRAEAATAATEALRLEVERLKLPEQAEDWSRLNGFVNSVAGPSVAGKAASSTAVAATELTGSKASRASRTVALASDPSVVSD
jgi:hypothetical protein